MENTNEKVSECSDGTIFSHQANPVPKRIVEDLRKSIETGCKSDLFDYPNLCKELGVRATIKARVQYIGINKCITIKTKQDIDKNVTLKQGDEFDFVIVMHRKGSEQTVQLGAEDEDGDLVWESDAVEFDKNFILFETVADEDVMEVSTETVEPNMLDISKRFEKLINVVRKEPLTVGELKLVKTCHACPEQYDVYDKYGNEIAYLRLRWGYFKVECPFKGEVVYIANTKGGGMFEDSEKDFYLTKAKEAIVKYYNTGETSSSYDED